MCSSTYMTQWDDRTWGGRRGSDELHPVFCVDRVSDVLWFEATHEMESFSSLVAKQVSGTFKEELFQKEPGTKIYAWSHFPSIRKERWALTKAF